MAATSSGTVRACRGWRAAPLQERWQDERGKHPLYDVGGGGNWSTADYYGAFVWQPGMPTFEDFAASADGHAGAERVLAECVAQAAELQQKRGQLYFGATFCVRSTECTIDDGQVYGPAHAALLMRTCAAHVHLCNWRRLHHPRPHLWQDCFDGACAACHALSFNPEFQRRVKARIDSADRPASKKTNFLHCTSEQKTARLQEYHDETKQLGRRSSVATLKAVEESVREQNEVADLQQREALAAAAASVREMFSSFIAASEAASSEVLAAAAAQVDTAIDAQRQAEADKEASLTH